MELVNSFQTKYSIDFDMELLKIYAARCGSDRLVDCETIYEFKRIVRELIARSTNNHIFDKISIEDLRALENDNVDGVCGLIYFEAICGKNYHVLNVLNRNDIVPTGVDLLVCLTKLSDYDGIVRLLTSSETTRLQIDESVIFDVVENFKTRL